MRLVRIVLVGVVLVVTAVAAALALAPATGHTPLHIGCKNHNHGPARTAGEGRRLLDARAINRQARQQSQQN